MDPVNGQLLANLPDFGIKEEGRVNDGLLGRDPRLGPVHHRRGVGGLGLVQLQGEKKQRDAGRRGWTEKQRIPESARAPALSPEEEAAPHSLFYLWALTGQQLPSSCLPLS